MYSSRTRRLLTTASVISVLALGAAACGSDDGNGDQAGDGKIRVVASTNVWGSVVEAVGGDRIDVQSLIDDPGGDPHSYEASARDAADVQSADVVVYNGGGYDQFFADLAEQASGVRQVVAFDVSGKDAGEQGHAEEEHAEHEHAHGDVNEHVWYDLATVAKVADEVADRLGEADPEGRQRFTANAADFTGRIDELTGKVERIGEEHPGSEVVATEPVAHYLLETAGVADVTPPDFAEAIEQETDVPVAARDAVQRLIRNGEVAAVVNNAQTVTPVTENVVGTARGANVPVVDVTETLPEGTTDYIAWMTGQVDALSGALGK
ncbi:metal ABC transporter solute-binding protein, Zn/Mn family [Qaidamihabitans albus]|uniref:metal ABC transporter solute-binding protein, Zn/Mn family n=1 Tax=Qaidamihabitans albus TaxID=2795733 RepID=UPI0018F1BF81|nr:zinc ABC transporter substrate-binding protein [Qaidamihabitans albus]